VQYQRIAPAGDAPAHGEALAATTNPIDMKVTRCGGVEPEGMLAPITASVARMIADSVPCGIFVEGRTFLESRCIEGLCIEIPWTESLGINIELLPAFLQCLLLAAPVR
jgi:hypothetical protein